MALHPQGCAEQLGISDGLPDGGIQFIEFFNTQRGFGKFFRSHRDGYPQCGEREGDEWQEVVHFVFDGSSFRTSAATFAPCMALPSGL